MRFFVNVCKRSIQGTTLLIISLIWASACNVSKRIEHYENGKIKSIEHFKKVNGRYISHGKHITFYPNGKKMGLRFFKNDSLVKFQKGWYETGRLKYINQIVGESSVKDTFEDNIILDTRVANYTTKTYYRNGKIESTGDYVARRKQNLWIFYDSTGKVLKKEFYRNDSLISSIK